MYRVLCSWVFHVLTYLSSKYCQIETRCGSGGGGCGSCPSSGLGAQNPALHPHNEGFKPDIDELNKPERPSKRSKQSPGDPPLCTGRIARFPQQGSRIRSYTSNLYLQERVSTIQSYPFGL